MPIALSATTIATILAGITGPAMSDFFTVTATGTYIFTASKNGPFITLIFQLETVHGFLAQTIATWDAVATSSFSFTLNPNVTYRLNCTNFSGGNATVTVGIPTSSSPPLPVELNDGTSPLGIPLNPMSINIVSGGAPSLNDPFVTWTIAADLTNQKIIGSFLTSVLQTALPFARGGTVLIPTIPINIIVWRATFPCTVVAVKGYTADVTGTTVNAQKNGSLTHLASDLTINAANSWIDGGSVQNILYTVGDRLEIMLTGIGGSPSQIAVQVEFTRP